jgi:glycine/D-amino acid oxidase-like deaminating enzyme
MKRDGACMSLSQQSMPEYESKNKKILPDIIYDVLIAGGGITGLTSALLLQKASKQCILAEAHTIGFGTTGGTTAHLNTRLDHPYNEIKSKFGEKNAQLLANATRQALRLIKK